MQLLIDQSKLDSALQAVGRVVPRRPVSSGVSAVLLSAQEGVLRLSATDLQSYAQVSLPAETHVQGDVAVEWQYFSRVVSSLSGGEVALSLSGSNRSLRLTCGPAAFRLKTRDADDFPTLETPLAWDFTMSMQKLSDLVARTTFCAVDSDESSPFFGVSLSAGPDGIKVAATDNFQLAHYEAPVERLERGTNRAPGFATVLPTRGLNAFARSLGSLGGERVDLAFVDQKLWLRSGRVTWSVRSLDTQYPDLERYTGRLGGVRVATRRSNLLEAVRQVSSLSDEGRAVAVRLEGSRLHLMSSRSEVGEAQTFVQLEAEYPTRHVWLDARRFQNALRAQPVEEVALYLSEPLAPVAVVPVDEGLRFRTLLTPLRYETEASEAI